MRANWKDFWYEFWKQKRPFSIVFFPFLFFWLLTFFLGQTRGSWQSSYSASSKKEWMTISSCQKFQILKQCYFFSFRILQNKQSPPFVQVCLIWCCPSFCCSMTFYFKSRIICPLWCPPIILKRASQTQKLSQCVICTSEYILIQPPVDLQLAAVAGSPCSCLPAPAVH